MSNRDRKRDHLRLAHSVKKPLDQQVEEAMEELFAGYHKITGEWRSEER